MSVRFPIRETLLNFAVATLINIPFVTTAWRAQKRLTPSLTLASYKVTFGRLLEHSVSGAGKESALDYWRNRSRDMEHPTRPWRNSSR